MNLNQEFHAHLQAGRLTDAISLVVGQLVELKITTKASSGRLHTTVDLLNGQITNTVDPAFFSDKASQKLLDFHTNQIAATSQVVREQLRSLQELLQALTPPEVSQENIKLIAITEGAEPVNTLATPAIISAQTSDTLPVTLTETFLSIPETSPEIVAPEPVAQPEPPVAKIPESVAQAKQPVAKVPEPLAQPEPPVAKVPKPTAQQEPPVAKVPERHQISEPEDDFDITAADLEPLSAKSSVNDRFAPVASWSEAEHVKLPESPPAVKPESRAGIASGLAAALAQTSALDPSEAAAIPNKFDQALRSAGVRSTPEEDPHPFATSKSVIEPIINQPINKLGTDKLEIDKPVIDQPTEPIPRQELIDLLRESEDDWDEWLLEEDSILSELSDVTKDKLPDLESHWLSAGESGATNSSVSVKSSPAEWEEFMPEYPEVNTVASKNQANVERFRQNLVNDPQLMSELLAELDDLEEGKSKL